MDKNISDALKTLLEALPEEVVAKVTSQLKHTTKPISEESRGQTQVRHRLLNFRLSPFFDDILENESTRTGQPRTTVLKAALAAYDQLDENQKNHWLLESAKLG